MSHLDLNPHVVQQTIKEGGAVLMNVETGDCFELNRLGTEILDELRKDPEPSKVAEQIAKRYSVDLASVRADVDALIENLTRSGLLIAK